MSTQPKPSADVSPFCPVCDRAMLRNYSGPHVELICKCGETKPGGKNDVVLIADLLVGGAGSSALSLYRTMFANAPFDPTSRFERRRCSGCGEEKEMAISRVSDSLITVYSCACGNIEL